MFPNKSIFIPIYFDTKYIFQCFYVSNIKSTDIYTNITNLNRIHKSKEQHFPLTLLFHYSKYCISINNIPFVDYAVIMCASTFSENYSTLTNKNKNYASLFKKI